LTRSGACWAILCYAPVLGSTYKLGGTIMGYLLSAGVIAFQIAILATIVGAARIGKKSLTITTLCWTAFTLFGSIFTAGLLLLQLATIFIAYNIGKKLFPATANRVVTRPPPQKTESYGWLITAIIILAGMATGKFLGRQSAEADIEELRQVRAARAIAQSAPAVANPSPASPLPPDYNPLRPNERKQLSAKEKAQNEEARQRVLDTTPEL